MKSIRGSSLLFSLAALPTLALAGACSAPTPSADERAGAASGAVTFVPVLPDFCTTQDADLTITVPEHFDGPQTELSGSGFYGYGGRLCPGWIVDIQLSRLSNATIDVNGNLKPNPVNVVSGAFDLPSSIAFGGLIPVTAEDCKRWSGTTTVYARDYLGNFTMTYFQKRTGVWSGGTCTSAVTGPTAPASLAPPTSGPLFAQNTYRVVSTTKLRTSLQETSVTISEPIAN